MPHRLPWQRGPRGAAPRTHLHPTDHRGLCRTGFTVPAATRPRWPRLPFPRCCVTTTRPRALPPHRVPISGFICCLLLHGGIFNLLITLRAEVVLGTHSRNVWKSVASGAAGTRPVPSHVSPPHPALGPPSCPAWRGTSSSSRTSTSWHRAAHGLAGLRSHTLWHHTHKQPGPVAGAAAQEVSRVPERVPAAWAAPGQAPRGSSMAEAGGESLAHNGRERHRGDFRLRENQGAVGGRGSPRNPA